VGMQEYAVAAVAEEQTSAKLHRDKSAWKVYQQVIQTLNVKM
jgi:hypothetical protein